MLVLGAGPGGYSAAFRAADLGMKTVLVERYATLGGVCLNVGCIPSKALLHVAAVMDEAAHFAALGVEFGAPKIDLDKLRAHKAKVVGKLTGGLTGMAKTRKVTTVRGVGRFVGPNHLEVQLTSGDGPGARPARRRSIRFAKAIIAAGSQAVKLPFIPDDPRVVDSTGALELREVPKRMLVIGGGIIGLEMATVYSTLGARIEVVEMLDRLMTGADHDLVRVWQKHNAKRFDKVMLKTKTVGVEAKPDGLLVRFEGEQSPAEPQLYDLVLVAVGRSPNGRQIGAEAAGVAVTDRGFIDVDTQMRTNVPHIYAIGDIIGNPMLAHKAVHEGHVAAEAAHGEKAFFDARVIPSVAYTDPEVAWVGLTEDEAKAQGVKVKVGTLSMGRERPRDRQRARRGLHEADLRRRRVTASSVAASSARTRATSISEIALAVEMGADAVDIGRTIHPHPTLGESVGLAAEVVEGRLHRRSAAAALTCRSSTSRSWVSRSATCRSERLAERLADGVGEALAYPRASCWVKLQTVARRRNTRRTGRRARRCRCSCACSSRTRIRPCGRSGRRRSPPSWRMATGRERASVHVIFEPDASGRVFFGGAPDVARR